MPKSVAFIRIKAAVIAVARAIPAGRVTTFRAVGMHLDVIPRQVAYILSTLTDEEKDSVPWHRVVSEEGRIERMKYNALGMSQIDLLAQEGVDVGANRVVQNFEICFYPISEETTGVHPIPRALNSE